MLPVFYFILTTVGRRHFTDEEVEAQKLGKTLTFPQLEGTGAKPLPLRPTVLPAHRCQEHGVGLRRRTQQSGSH